jgi:hypothetical protein
MGNPLKLWQTAGDWSQTVGTPVSKKVMFADLNALKFDDGDNWTGDAATKYKNSLLAQRLALQAVKANFSDGVQLPLRQVAGGIVAFWLCMIGAVVAFVKLMAAGIAACSTVFGIPPGIVLAIKAVLIPLGLITAGILTLRGLATDAKSDLLTKLDFSSYEGGNWPKSTA